MKKFFILLTVFVFTTLNTFAQEIRNSHYITNQAPLLVQPFTSLPLGSIKPKGWLRTMLELQRDGLTGQLDSVYEVVAGDNNGWLGGTGDSWERGPYWLDGLTPLAYILEDDFLMEKVEKWVDWSIEHQRENGYFGPYPIDEDTPRIPGTQQTPSEDWWPKMVMLKVLQQYYSATQDERVIDLMDRYFRYQLQELPYTPLGHYTFWANRRGGDNLQVVYWLYNITKKDYLLDLARLIHEQTYDWTSVLSGDFIRNVNPYPPLHCVNVAQGLKEPVVFYQQSHDSVHLKAPRLGLESLQQVHGFANGMYGGDEGLHGNDPIQGSEFCSAVELMFSLESMLAVTGDLYYADYLEKVGYNVLPTQHDDKFMHKQYFQQPNQIKVTHEYRNFRDSHHGSNTVYGILTGYPCCLSNMHQGWPKLVQNLFYASADNGVAALVYGPAETEVTVGNGVQVQIKEETNYPFDEEIRFIVVPEIETIFPFYLRIPGWCKDPEVQVNGEKVDLDVEDNLLKLDRQWEKGDVIQLILPMEIRTSRWYELSAAVERGPLLYALKIQESWQEKTNDLWPNSFYEVYPKSPWNYGLRRSDLEEKDFEVRLKGGDIKMPWNLGNAPISINLPGQRIPYWKEYNGSTGKIPYPQWPSQDYGTEPEVIELIPYGCTTLRISQFPVID